MFFPVGNRLNHSRERIVKDVPQAVTAAAGPYLASAKWTDKTAGRWSQDPALGNYVSTFKKNN